MPQPVSRKVLIVEDEALLLEAYVAKLAFDGIIVVGAETLMEAVAAFEANPDLAAVAVDGLFPHSAGGSHLPDPGRLSNGEKFVLFLKGERFAGPIYACSSLPKLCQKMRDLGATETCEKGNALCDALRKLLPRP